MRTYKNIFLAFLLVITGCNDFLDEAPSKTSSLVVTTVEQLDALLGSYSTFHQLADLSSVYSADDNGLSPELYAARPATFPIGDVQYFLWDVDNIANDMRATLWSNEFRKIFYANMVLENLGNVSGDPALKAELRAEAHLMRAYSYLELANTYCLPFSENTKNELGLPLKQSTSFEELSTRNTLEETHALIESDIEEAFKTTTPLLQDGRVRYWRGNVAAVNAFASRYWLGRNDYDKALQYANTALGLHSELVDYNTEMRYSEIVTAAMINPLDPVNREVVYLKQPYTSDNQTDFSDMLNWKEFYYFRCLYYASWWYAPGEELLDLYGRDTMDLRYRYHVVEHYSYRMGMTSPAYDYPGYLFFFRDRIPSGPTVAEMLLTKAECLARAGNVSDAMSTVNQLRVKRMDASLPANEINLSASTPGDALKKILEERRRELPFSRRWFDIRRFNHNDDPSDDVTLSRQFYPYTSSAVLLSEPLQTYTLPKDSRRYAVPIPNTDITSSDGKLKQNTY